mgnify:CR=1 FL=1
MAVISGRRCRFLATGMVLAVTLAAAPPWVRGEDGAVSAPGPNFRTAASDGLRRHVERDHPDRLGFPSWARPRAGRPAAEYDTGLRHGEGFTGHGRFR